MRLSWTDRHQQPPRPETKERAIAGLLSHDHQRLEQRFQAIVNDASIDDPGAFRQEWQAFEADVLRHFDLEEGEILPAFAREQPMEARLLLEEHEQLRNRMTELGVDLDLHCLPAEQVGAFVDTLRAHARHEDEVLYPWAERCLGEAALGRLQTGLSEATPAASGDQTEWQIDAERSSLRFSLRHIVVHQIRGQFRKWGGTLVLDEDDLTRSSVRIWIDLDSVETGDPDRDVQVRSAEFFDVARFPQARFSSTEVCVLERGNPVVKGRLELHGSAREIALEITSRERWIDDSGAVRVLFGVRARLDRRSFGLRWNQDLDVGGVVVGDEIELAAQVEAVRRAPAP
jgi:polyisoprenoid-binding protein YceI